MNLDLEQVARVARLARLRLPSPERTRRYAHELSEILAMVGQLARVPTDGVEPMAHPLGMTQRLREDAVTDPVGDNGRSRFQAAAPAVADGLYLVPKVIE